jgi:prepilin-type processing-associated H-X9-DG protein
MAIYPYVKNKAVYQCPDDNIEEDDNWSNAACSDDAGKNDYFGQVDPVTLVPCSSDDVNCNPNYVSYGFDEYLADNPSLAAIPAPAHELLLADSVNQLASVGPVGWWNSSQNSIVARVAFATDTGAIWGECQNESYSGCLWNYSFTASNFLQYFTETQLEAATRHRGGDNIAYADGHSKYMKWSAMTFCALSSETPSCPQ